MTKAKKSAKRFSADQEKIIQARHHDPFNYLGLHRGNDKASLRIYAPHTREVSLAQSRESLQRIGDSDFFEWNGANEDIVDHAKLLREDDSGQQIEFYDTYSFAAQLSDFDLHLFGEGRHWHIYRYLGAHVKTVDGISGVLFATWAPTAQRVSVIGDFNRWDGRTHQMRSRGGSGVWELFIPGLQAGDMYKFEIRTQNSEHIAKKIDPYALQFELRPSTACIISAEKSYTWSDHEWLQARQQRDWLRTPMSVYELHLGSWRQGDGESFLNYRDLADQLVEYLQQTGFTHIELLPITEHPLDDSWGYQTTGYFAPTSRFGDADDFRYFVDTLHQAGFGVILDWVPAHFPKDAHALARFDGSGLYEHEDPRKGEHPDWGTLIYNYGRNEVKNFLLSSALFWLEEFHLDGLRVDAVASMLYLDYSREDQDWVPNIHGGNENLEAIEFLRELNTVTHEQFPGTLVIAEESTAWPQVTRPVNLGGLGFSMKWNMGWMHDTLSYMQKAPIFRHYHHNQLTFGLLYLFSENFVLPFSHDEVVHGKGSMIYKMPGDDWQRFANLRLLYTYMFTYPGKKLLFMGSEFAQTREWNHKQSLDWHLLEYAPHACMKTLVGDLNDLYKHNKALYLHDFEPTGFEWIDCNDSEQSVLSYLRKGDGELIIVILNFTPVPREGYRVGVPEAGLYEEVLNSDSEFYDGSNMGNEHDIAAEDLEWMGRPHSLELTLPPLAGLVLRKRQG
ncbi:MAG: 1,4-alpha-glucan branching protein GlgB [Gammaproteobacteria bacterium]|nr:1,4-alpha-glucan branching protein GlgB [Gammaproteobacteria bacterium]